MELVRHTLLTELLFLALPLSETIYQVVIYQAGGLKVGVDDSRAQELKSPAFHIF